jgi:hypothetical protein
MAVSVITAVSIAGTCFENEIRIGVQRPRSKRTLAAINPKPRMQHATHHPAKNVSLGVHCSSRSPDTGNDGSEAFRYPF